MAGFVHLDGRGSGDGTLRSRAIPSRKHLLFCVWVTICISFSLRHGLNLERSPVLLAAVRCCGRERSCWQAMNMKMSRRVLALLALASVANAQGVVNGQRNVLGRLSTSGPNSSVDFTAAGMTSPVKTGTLAARPVNCSQGEMYFATDATAGQNLYLCTTPGTPGVWTLQGGSGGAERIRLHAALHPHWDFN